MSVQIDGSTGNIIATKADYSGDVSIGGTLTYEDVTNIDSVGIITARSGINVTGGDVGIGLTNPEDYGNFADDLVIYDSSQPGMTFATGTSGYGSIYFADGTAGNAASRGQIQYGHSDDYMAFATAASEALRIDSSGRLLVGGTSAAATDSDSKLQVISTGNPKFILARNDTSISSGQNIGNIIWYGNDSDGTFQQCATINAIADLDHGTGDKPTRLTFATTADGASSTTERMRIDSSGDVQARRARSNTAGDVALSIQPSDSTIHYGLRIDSTNNSLNLDRASGTAANLLVIDSSGNLGLGGITSPTWASDGGIHLGDDYGIGFGDGGSGRPDFQVITAGDGTLDIRCGFGADDADITINSSGRVDIKQGDLRVTGGEGVSAALYLVADQGDDNGDSWRIISNQDANDLTISNDDSGSFSDLFTFTKAGHLGVGHGSPQFGITINQTSDDSGAIGWEDGSNNKRASIRCDAADDRLQFHTGTGDSERMSIQSNGRVNMFEVYGTALSGTMRDVHIENGGQLGYSSSTRDSKENISLLNNVDWLYQLQPSSFNYKKRDKNGEYTGEASPELEYGLIAEDVEPIAPELCFYDEVDGEMELRGIHYKKLIVPLLKALQELSAKNAALEARIAALEG